MADNPMQRVETDVLIATDLTLPGGNASDTLDEIEFLSAHGISAALVHLSDHDHVEYSTRYADLSKQILALQDIAHIQTSLLLVRHPRALCARHLPELIQRSHAKRTAFVINNSWRDRNRHMIFDYGRVFRSLFAAPGTERRMYPLSPQIRREMELGPDWITPLIAETWPPTINTNQFDQAPKPRIPASPTIGRHSRDGLEKWPETKDDLLGVYPADSHLRVSILGGASSVKNMLAGPIPDNWTVHEFGAMSPEEFLASLDVYVYFPHSGLDEAFGRGPLEAMAMGLPCILPKRFRINFGDKAFYAKPGHVGHIVERLKEKPKERQAFLARVKEKVTLEFGTDTLKSRFHEFFPDEPKPKASPKLTAKMLSYRRWVETGES